MITSDRTKNTLSVFKDKVIMISGGKDKGIPYDEIGPEIVDHVRVLILIGATSKAIESAVYKTYKERNINPSVKIIHAKTYPEAVKEAKENAKSAKRIITRTHMISIVPIINQSIEEDRSVDDMVKLFSKFYAGKKSASISETYNNYAGSGSAKKEAVRKRLDELRKSYTEFFTH